MADYVRLAVDGGARIVGGCCGTSFEHLAAMRQALDASPQGYVRPTVEARRRAHRPAAQQGGERRAVPVRPAKAAANGRRGWG
jgi:hypothetical protein